MIIPIIEIKIVLQTTQLFWY